MKRIIFIGAVLFFAPKNITAQDTLSRVDLIRAVFRAALISEKPDTLSGYLYRVQVDSTIIMWSASFGYGKVWLKGDRTGFTFRYDNDGNSWVFILSDEAQQKLEALDAPYVIEILKKIKNKK
ncbi:MAG: hypothetical protein ACKOW9_01235 [Candidatus Paceibacterota bacterium]